MESYPRIAGINYESTVDGEGVRTAIYLSGCNHHCPECHNPETHDPNFGTIVTRELIRKIAAEFVKRPFLSGITLTGGDPLYNTQKTAAFLKMLLFEISSFKHFTTFGKAANLWIYTGYTYEQLRKTVASDKYLRELLCCYGTVLVDGRFEAALADKTLTFRGSSNQRIIDLFYSYDNAPYYLKAFPTLWMPQHHFLF